MHNLHVLAALTLLAPAASVAAMPAAVPEFTQTAAAEWINSPPLTMSALRGQVVLVEFWTFDCWNCRNTLPWLKAVHARYASQGLIVVSVHTPELPQERVPANVRAAVKQLGIDWPVMIDGDFSYWRALGNRYWPAFYLVGRDGRVVETAIGELHEKQGNGDLFEAAIREQLRN